MLKNSYFVFAITLLEVFAPSETLGAPLVCGGDSAAVLDSVRSLVQVRKFNRALSCLEAARNENLQDRDLAFMRVRVLAWSGRNSKAQSEFEKVRSNDAESEALALDLKRYRGGHEPGDVKEKQKTFDREVSLKLAGKWNSAHGYGREQFAGISHTLGSFKVRAAGFRQSESRFGDEPEFTFGAGLGVSTEVSYSELFLESGFQTIILNRTGTTFYHEQNLTEKLFAFGNIKRSYYRDSEATQYALGGGWYGEKYFPKLSLYSPLSGETRGTAVFDVVRLWPTYDAGVRVSGGKLVNPRPWLPDSTDLVFFGGGILGKISLVSGLDLDLLYEEKFAKGYREKHGEIGVTWAF